MLAAVAVALSASGGWADEVRFNRDIRPILSENCFHCHGPDEETRAAGLRLDRPEEAREFAILPGNAADSELIFRVTHEDPSMVMPPPDSERSLSEAQIELLRRWIDQGAGYEMHWSFVPPRHAEPPSPVECRSGNSPIDRFIDRELGDRGLEISGPASREALIRRATFDLTGLPPTLEEIDAFVSDESPDAYSRLLDRLLASERFGERMASDWLDVARYSDTYGYQVDRDRSVWAWRDWVIAAFNRGLPYDEFITQQLAGDLLPASNRSQTLATTFNRLHPQKVEGGSVPEEFRVEYVADRTQTVATGIMGLTFECCRCHNHKYDPFSQREYYELSAFFDNIDEAGLYSYFTDSVPTPTLPLPTSKQERRLEAARAELRRAEAEWRRERASRLPAAEAWVGGETEHPGVIYAEPIFSLDFESPPDPPNAATDGVLGKAIRLTGDDGLGTDVGNFRRFEPFSVSLWIKTPDTKERAVIFHRSRAWTDAGSRGYQLLLESGRLSWSLIHFWPGNAIRVRAADAIPRDRWVHVTVTYDGSSRAAGLGLFVDGRRVDTETVRDGLEKQITGGGGNTITIGERFRDRGFTDGCVDEFQVYDYELSAAEVSLLSTAEPRRAWPSDSGALAAELSKDLRIDHYFKRIDPEMAGRRAALREARARLCTLQDEVDEIMVMRELPSQRQTFLLRRGQYDQRGEPVQPDTPDSLTGFPERAPRNRLGLARWLTDADHPLTSRVAVNRLWQLLFGSGLVRTPEDFGSQGEPPTHPELLDWLALDFAAHGWDIKRMLKRIMMTSAYRRSSVPVAADVVRRDPENRWLARFPSYRLPAEMLRDNALAVSGYLSRKIGGPPVKPYEISASFKPSGPDAGERLYRRSVYTYWKRTAPAPAMLTLDAAKRDVCRVKRERTASPLQAFVMLNGPQFVESARGFAERLQARYRDDSRSALRHAFRRLTSRRPGEDELGVLEEMYRDQLEYFRNDSSRVDAFMEVGESKPAASLDGARVAATAVVINMLMNFDSCVIKR